MQHLIVLAMLAGCTRAPATCPPLAPAQPASAKPAMSDLVIARGAHDHTETLSRAVTAIEARGFAIVQRIDHAAAAATAGQELPPSTVLVFGNPKAGTQLMLLAPSLALDLPLRLVVWKAGEIVQVARVHNVASIRRWLWRGQSEAEDAGGRSAEAGGAG